jgi:hypothetical protein
LALSKTLRQHRQYMRARLEKYMTIRPCSNVVVHLYVTSILLLPFSRSISLILCVFVLFFPPFQPALRPPPSAYRNKSIPLLATRSMDSSTIFLD